MITPLQTPVQFIKGVGPRRASTLGKLGISTVRDLLYYFPRGYIDLSKVEKIVDLRRSPGIDGLRTVIGTVRTFDVMGRPPRQRFVLVLGDETGTIQIVFFRSIHYFRHAFSAGEQLAVSGRVTEYQQRLQMVHPGIERLKDEPALNDAAGGLIHTAGIVPKYSSSEELREVRLDTRGFRRIIRAALDEFSEAIEEFLPEELRAKHVYPGIVDAVRAIHYPESFEVLEASCTRLKYDELFLLQLLLALRRAFVKSESPGIPFDVESSYARSLVNSLPYALTKAQVKVMNEIAADMREARPMNRLLQGDVGSGKTIVALLAMVIAVQNGYQAALMAPTEILAEQHFRNLSSYLKDLPITVSLLVSGQRKARREELLEDIRSGNTHIVVGTHALIQDTVRFARLGLAVIDEQHRFGVEQRFALRRKQAILENPSIQPDVLVMTATPIPRTLALTLYGDLDVSVISELPKGRKPVTTLLKFESQRKAVYRFLHDEIDAGRQAYIVYPIIEESEKLDLRSATEGYEHLKLSVFPGLRLGLLHGRMDSGEQEAIMKEFKEGRIDILVATTIIEVGIDVPNASVMLIEHAERFGLSQLHQLRGRVGRGAEQSYCLLVAPDWMASRLKETRYELPLDEEEAEEQKSLRRLKTMASTNDGFRIAEVDLEIRGPGDFFGRRQSGLPELQIANLVTDSEILLRAREDAMNIVRLDPHLRAPENKKLRRHLDAYFGDALELFRAG
jgi:ATP-dependent DNA helicase RecG